MEGSQVTVKNSATGVAQISNKTITSVAVLGADLRPSRGVGDFARRVASELKRQGLGGTIEDRTSGELAEHAVAEPQGVFLQFVPYAWQLKGIIGADQRAEIIQRCAGRRVVVYMHELWVGESRNERWRNRLVGWWQRRGVVRLLEALRPESIVTSNSAYQAVLAMNGLDAEVLPLPSNLPEPSEADLNEATAWLEERELFEKGQFELGAVFGVIHPEWNPVAAVQEWSDMARAHGRQPVLLTLGKSGLAAKPILEQLQREVKGLRVERAGALTAGLLAALIRRVELGFATTPWNLIGKSGSAAAFRAAGVPVLVTRHDWVWRRGHLSPPQARAGLRLWHPNFDWDQLLAERAPDGISTAEIVDRLRRILNGNTSHSGSGSVPEKRVRFGGGTG